MTDDENAIRMSQVHMDLIGLHESARVVLTTSIEARPADIGRLLQLDRDLSDWVARLHERPESILLTEALRQLGFATYAASAGLYSLAYAGLRVFLELSFAAVYFSANELRRRKWVADRADFSWSRALDQHEGLLTAHFIREFHPMASSEASQYADQAQRCYRQCSQFMHGKVAVTSTLPQELSYSDVVLAEWAAQGQSAAEAVLFLVYCRYSDELLPADDGHLSSTLEHWLGHLRCVRNDLGLPVEVEA